MHIMLEARGIAGGYGMDAVVKGISFDIKKGDFLGIIGPNGSGKSTLLRLLSGVLRQYSGSVRLEGKDTRTIKRKEFFRKVAFVPQDTMINFSFSVEEIVLMGRIPHMRRMQFETKKDLSIVNSALSLTDSAHIKDREINELSAGERQRVIIAKALAQEPALLFLDEPTSHLDIGHQVQILDLLRMLNRKEGLTIVTVMHDLNLAAEYCERVILFNNGTIFKDGIAEEVLTYKNIEEVYKTVVVVSPNPVSRKPQVVLVPGEDRCVNG